MLRLARAHVGSHAAAEDVVQDAWAVVLKGIDRFEGRSTLRTYVLGIVVNVARRAGQLERRTVPFSSAWRQERGDEQAPAVSPDRFAADGAWLIPPSLWASTPDDVLSAAELRAVLEDALDRLPWRQRAVVTARDVLGLDPEEVADVCGLSVGNQRVLLHRARAKLRAAVEGYLGGEGSVPVRGHRPGPPKRGHAIACRQLVELVDDYLDGRLTPDLRSRVEEHLAGCDHCGEYVAQVRRVLDVTAILNAQAPALVIDRLLEVLRGQSRPAGQSPPVG